MAETTRRVSVTLTFAVDDMPADVAYSVMAVVRDESRYAQDVEAVNVHAFDLAEDKPEPAVYLVAEGSLLAGAYVDDPDGADEMARTIGGVVFELPVTADHRPTVSKENHDV